MGHKRIRMDLLIHDLKVPLAVIEAGTTSLLKKTEKYGPLTEQQEKVLVRVLRNVKATQTLVNDAMELGRSRQGIVHLSKFTISALIEQTLVETLDLADSSASEKVYSCTDLNLLKEELKERGVILSVDEDIWCRELLLDKAKVQQILRNLLNNALKYRKKQVELGVWQENSFLVMSVKDDGEGIPAIYHEKIFDSYFQLDASDCCSVRGHGLGLAGVMVLVEDMGGELMLESDAGTGAKFSVKVPLDSDK